MMFKFILKLLFGEPETKFRRDDKVIDFVAGKPILKDTYNINK